MSVFNSVANAAGGVVDNARGAAGVVGGVASGVAGLAVRTAEEELGDARRRIADLEARVRAFADEKRTLLERFEEEKRAAVSRFIVARIAAAFEFIMAAMLGRVKLAVRDPFMPLCVARRIEVVLDVVWPDVKSEVRESIVSGVAKVPQIDHGTPWCCGRGNPVAFIRYHWNPYDKNIWQLIRDPLWVVFNAVSLIPRFGICYGFYIVLFAVMDKGDVYQLLHFIVEFKGLMFLSLGVVGSIIGVVMYHICINTGSCDRWGPGEPEYTFVLFVLQIFMVWAAFGLSFCAERKGGVYHRITEAERRMEREAERSDPAAQKAKLLDVLRGDIAAAHAAAEGRQAPGRRSSVLLGFLIYDLVVFVLCLSLGLGAAFFNGLDRDSEVLRHGSGVRRGNWKFHASLYLVKTLYGLLSAPFLLLKLPGAAALLSRARPTGYNPWGKCVPFVGKFEAAVPWLSPEECQRRLDAVEARKEAQRFELDGPREDDYSPQAEAWRSRCRNTGPDFVPAPEGGLYGDARQTGGAAVSHSAVAVDSELEQQSSAAPDAPPLPAGGLYGGGVATFQGGSGAQAPPVAHAGLAQRRSFDARSGPPPSVHSDGSHRHPGRAGEPIHPGGARFSSEAGAPPDGYYGAGGAVFNATEL